MRLAIIGEKNKTSKEYIDTFQNYFCNINDALFEDIVFYENSAQLLKELNDYDIIITIDLAGFEKCTLTEGLSYNLINSKFINLLLHEDLPNEKMLNKQLSISMFCYCVGKKYHDYLLKSYPRIPYLRELKGWKDAHNDQCARDNNMACIVSVIEEIVKA